MADPAPHPPGQAVAGPHLTEDDNANLTPEEVEAAALAEEGVKRALDNKPPKKVIVIPNRIVNVVA